VREWFDLVYPWRVEIGVCLLATLMVWIFALSMRNYRMLKYLTGGRSYAVRFRLIKERFARLRRARRG
jgi:hypothetical protein